MSIESKDVAGAQSPTPTFTERTITGTARVQNNRTMMLASVTTEVESNGRQGLPVLGGLPWLGRLFTAPTRENRQVDIVIAVTPRVLRAPAVTPRDEKMRPSGTLSNPTTGSIVAMIREADREDQLAMAKQTAKTQRLASQISPGTFGDGGVVNAGQAQPATNGPVAPTPTTVAQQIAPAVSQGTEIAADEPYVPAPKPLISTQAAGQVAALSNSFNGYNGASLTTTPRAVEVSLPKIGDSRTAQLKLTSADGPWKVGEKRTVSIELNSGVPLGLAVLTLKFDPNVVRIRGVSSGSMIAGAPGTVPSISQSIDPSGVCLISISALNGAPALKGTGVLLLLDVEAVGAGDGGFSFDKLKTNLVATDARDIVLELAQSQIVVRE
jgi:general secretion pathway protein D